MARSGSNKKVANGLVAMSSAAVLTVYSAGYVRTRPAADRLAQQALERTLARDVPPDAPAASPEMTHAQPELPKPSEEISKPHRKSEPVVQSKVIAPATPTSVKVVPVEKPEPVAAPSTPVAIPTPQAEEPAPVVAPVVPAPKVWKDGKYVGWGGSRHGDIQATVVIEAGRIISAEITDCQTRYPCDVIEKLPGQVITRQSPNVQRVSGATESADAFYSAVYFALKQAQ